MSAIDILQHAMDDINIASEALSSLEGDNDDYDSPISLSLQSALNHLQQALYDIEDILNG
jgi:hypothetical protein